MGYGEYEEYLMHADRGCFEYCGRIEFLPTWQVCCKVDGREALFSLREGCPEEEPEKQYCDKVPYDPRRMHCCKLPSFDFEKEEEEKPRFSFNNFFGGNSNPDVGAGSRSILMPVGEPCPGDEKPTEEPPMTVEPETEGPVTKDPTEVPTIECPPGQYPNENTNTCWRCQPGTFSAEGLECVPCPVNHFQPSAAASMCMPCMGNSVATEEGSTRCEDPEPEEEVCPPGTEMMFKRCQPCSAGRFNSVENGVCEPCSMGTYSDVQGATECKRCESGMTTMAEGATGCVRDMFNNDGNKPFGK